eukprot:scaffold3.g6591.t1
MPKGARRPRARPAGGTGGAEQQNKAGKELTPFQRRVYDLAKAAIPAGKVTTYGAIAEALGSAPRAVGQAMRNNPYAPVVPCHRVIAATLQLGGFKGEWGAGCAEVQNKRALLRQEGVEFDDAGRLATQGCVLSAQELLAAAAKAAPAGGRGGKR